MGKKVRSYQRVVERLQKISRESPHLQLIQLGVVASSSQFSYPFFSIQTKVLEKNRRLSSHGICLTAGTHGDEPSGVEAILRFLEQHREINPLNQGIHMTILPCINPFGYEHNLRENGNHIDLNRQFRKENPPQEVDLALRAFGRKTFDISVEFHEDVDTHGFYLYEINPKEKEGWGESIINALQGHYPINHNSKIDGLNSKKGIISRKDIEPQFESWIQQRDDWPQAFFHYQRGTPRCITSETPVNLALKERADMHLLVMGTILKRLNSTKKLPSPS